MPAILAGAGILAVVGLLVFWPSGDEDAKNAKQDDKSAARANSQSGAARASADAARGQGGVAARAVDDAMPGSSAVGKINPNLLPKKVGMAPGIPEDEPPPKFDNVADEIAFYEKRLERARTELEAREKNVERLAKTKQVAEDSPDSAAAMARYEKSKKIVEDNLAKAKKKIADLEEKISALREEG